MSKVIEAPLPVIYKNEVKQKSNYWCNQPLQLSFRRFGNENFNSDFPPSYVFKTGEKIIQNEASLPASLGRLYHPKLMEGFQSNLVISDGYLKVNEPKRIPNPEKFGGGKPGYSAYNALIYSERGCERIVNEDTFERCGAEPTQTLDFDVMGAFDHILICDQECFIATEQLVNEGLKKSGRSRSEVGRNGVERSSFRLLPTIVELGIPGNL